MQFIKKKNLFAYGPVDKSAIVESVETLTPGLTIPEDLMTFWETFGGGDLYESECFFYPLSHHEYENVVEMNKWLWNEGVSKDLFVFYLGSFGYGALKVGSTEIYLLDGQDLLFSSKLTSFSTLLDMLDQEFKSMYPS
jgi:hypothetical protein